MTVVNPIPQTFNLRLRLRVGRPNLEKIAQWFMDTHPPGAPFLVWKFVEAFGNILEEGTNDYYPETIRHILVLTLDDGDCDVDTTMGPDGQKVWHFNGRSVADAKFKCFARLANGVEHFFVTFNELEDWMKAARRNFTEDDSMSPGVHDRAFKKTRH